MNNKINKLQKVNHEASDSNRYVVTYLRGENKGKKITRSTPSKSRVNSQSSF